MSQFQRPSPDRTAFRFFGKWKRRLLSACAGFLALLVFSPLLVSRTPLRNGLLAYAVPHFQGSIRIGGASLGWFRRPVFTDIEVRDPAGRTLLHVPRIEGEKTLLELLCHPLNLGVFRVTQPVVHVVCSRNSTNWEEALAQWREKTQTPSESESLVRGVAVRVEIERACLTLEDEDSDRKWSLDALDLSLAIPGDRRSPARIKLSGTIADGRRTGRLSAEVSARLIEANDAAPRLRAEGELNAEDVPLAAAEPFLRRLEPGIKLDGWIQAQIKLPAREEQPTAPDVRMEGRLALQALTLSDPVLGSDVLKLSRVEVPCRFALDGTRMILERGEIQSSAGKLSLAGTIDVTKPLADALNLPGHRLEAELNLARLADLLPNTLHLAKDTRIQSGTFCVRLRSSLRGNSLLWEGDSHTSDLEGTYQGQRLNWKEPFAVVFTIHQDSSALLPVVDRFRCDSDFLRLEMSGSLNDWSAQGRFNLGRLCEHLAGFVELGSLNVQGEGTLRSSVRRNPRGGYRLESDLQLTQLKLSEGGRACREDNLSLHLDLVGDAATGAYRVNAGGLHVLAGKDGIDLELLEPIPDVAAFHTVRARMRVHGDLTRWHGRMAGLTGLFEGVSAAGQIDVDGRMRYDADTLHVEDLKVSGHALRVRGDGLNVEEPAFEFTTSGRWLGERETLELLHTRISCSTLTVQAPTVTLATDRTGAWQIAASATVQGDVARLRRSIAASSSNEPDSLSGALAGRIDLRPDDGRQIVQCDFNVQNLVIGSVAAPTWCEARVNVTGHGVYDMLKDSFQIVQFHVDSPTLRCDAAGKLGALRSDKELSLDGKLSYDLDKLEPQLRPYLGQSVRFVGRDTRAFHLVGSLAVASETPLNLVVSPSASPSPSSVLGRMSGDAGLSWQSLQALGCQIGPGELRGQLKQGSLRLAAIDTTFNQGRLRLEPSLRLEPTPLEVGLAKGRVLDRVRLTPAACASALGYALPVLADVAQAEGEISLELDAAKVPLDKPNRAEIAGRLIIHSAEVSASPLVRELSVLLKGPPTLSLAKDDVVPFRVVNGRVYHSGLELRFPELTIRTSGSVGLDGTLALVAEMPVPPKWLGSSRLARAVGSQSIRLPIGGTLHEPKLDEKALRTASAQFVRDASENALRQEIDGALKKETENGLRKLFRPRK